MIDQQTYTSSINKAAFMYAKLKTLKLEHARYHVIQNRLGVVFYNGEKRFKLRMILNDAHTVRIDVQHDQHHYIILEDQKKLVNAIKRLTQGAGYYESHGQGTPQIMQD